VSLYGTISKLSPRQQLSRATMMKKIIDFFHGVDRFVAEAPMSLVVLLAILFVFGMMTLLVWLNLLVMS
jgi:hypothetical protein